MKELCPRSKRGKRKRMVITVDAELNKLLDEQYEQGRQVSHIIDSALWLYFGKPKLSFELDGEQ